jgi:hypothetical protein
MGALSILCIGDGGRSSVETSRPFDDLYPGHAPSVPAALKSVRKISCVFFLSSFPLNELLQRHSSGVSDVYTELNWRQRLANCLSMPSHMPYGGHCRMVIELLLQRG